MKRVCGRKAIGLFGTPFGLLLPGVASAQRMSPICGVVMLLATSALGQTNTFDIVVSNVVSPEQPSATVEVWAAFDPDQYAFWEAKFDFVATADPGAFSDPERLLKFGGNDGEVSPDGDTVMGIDSAQLHFPGSIFADTSNPILIWRVTWSTDDFSPRSIQLATVTSLYSLYTDGNGSGKDFTDTVVEGGGVVQVVPSPGAAWPLGLLAAYWRRRRRR